MDAVSLIAVLGVSGLALAAAITMSLIFMKVSQIESDV